MSSQDRMTPLVEHIAKSIYRRTSMTYSEIWNIFFEELAYHKRGWPSPDEREHEYYAWLRTWDKIFGRTSTMDDCPLWDNTTGFVMSSSEYTHTVAELFVNAISRGPAHQQQQQQRIEYRRPSGRAYTEEPQPTSTYDHIFHDQAVVGRIRSRVVTIEEVPDEHSKATKAHPDFGKAKNKTTETLLVSDTSSGEPGWTSVPTKDNRTHGRALPLISLGSEPVYFGPSRSPPGNTACAVVPFQEEELTLIKEKLASQEAAFARQEAKLARREAEFQATMKRMEARMAGQQQTLAALGEAVASLDASSQVQGLNSEGSSREPAIFSYTTAVAKEVAHVPAQNPERQLVRSGRPSGTLKGIKEGEEMEGEEMEGEEKEGKKKDTNEFW